MVNSHGPNDPVTSPAVAALNSRGIRIKVLPPPSEGDELFDRFSMFLGDRYNHLSDLLRWLKRCMQGGDRFTMNLRSTPQEHITSICQFCGDLHKAAFLTSFRYSKSPLFKLEATVSNAPHVQKLLGGHWLERYVVLTVCRHGITDLLLNPQVILPNGDDFELDIFATDIHGEPLWIEAKTGDYQNHVVKYSKMARVLGLNRERSILLVPDLPRDQCRSLGGLYGLTVLNMEMWHGMWGPNSPKRGSSEPTVSTGFPGQ